MTRHVDGMRRRLHTIREELNKTVIGRRWAFILAGDEQIPEWISEKMVEEDQIYIRRVQTGFEMRDKNNPWSYGHCVVNGVCYNSWNNGQVTSNRVP